MRAAKFKELLSIAMKFTSRILEVLMAWLGLVESREGIGLAFLYWVVVAAVEASVEEEESA